MSHHHQRHRESTREKVVRSMMMLSRQTMVRARTVSVAVYDSMIDQYRPGQRQQCKRIFSLISLRNRRPQLQCHDQNHLTRSHLTSDTQHKHHYLLHRSLSSHANGLSRLRANDQTLPLQQHRV